MAQRYKIAIYVPKAHIDKVKTAAFQAGAGRIGLYKDVSFVTAGTGEFTPDASAKPAIGKPGEQERVEEFKLELSSHGEEATRGIVKAMREAHPYEEVVCDVYRLEDF